MNLLNNISNAKSAVSSALSGVPTLIALPVAGVCALAVGITAAALTTGSKPVEFTDSKVPAKVLSASDSQKPAEPNNTSSDITSAGSTGQSSPPASATAAAPQQKPVTPTKTPTQSTAPKPAPSAPPTIDRLPSTALIAIPDMATAHAVTNIPGNLRIVMDFAIVRDGSYMSPVTFFGDIIGGPGGIQDTFCITNYPHPGSNNGTITIIANETAPNGIYTCRLKATVGYNSYETTLKFEIDDEGMSLLEGYTVHPGR